MEQTILVGVIALLIGGYLGWLFSPRSAFKPAERTVERVVVFGDASSIKLYQVWAPDTSSEKHEWMGGAAYASGKYEYYTTCEQAHATYPGEEVKVVEALVVGDTYVTGNFRVCEVQPKPKVAKGRK